MRQPAFRMLFFVLLIIQLSVFNLAQSTNQPLEQGKPVERELKGGEVHAYSIQLKSNQLLNLIVDQRGIDVVVELFAPDDKLLREVDSPNGTQGPEPLTIVAETSGEYQLKVRSLEKEAVAGRYEVRFETLRDATKQDKIENLAANLTAAKTDNERAALLSKEKELVTAELSIALNRRGIRFFEQGDYPTALAVLQLTQSITEKISDKVGMINSLNNIGNVYQLQGNYGRALELYQKALPMAEATGDKKMIFISLNNIGNAYFFQGNAAQALEFYRQSLAIAEPLGNKKQISAVLNNLGNVNKERANYPQALDYYRKSLTLS